MCFKTISKPTLGCTGGMTGLSFSKNSIGDFTGSNFAGAHHLCTKTKIPSTMDKQNMLHGHNKSKNNNNTHEMGINGKLFNVVEEV